MAAIPDSHTSRRLAEQIDYVSFDPWDMTVFQLLKSDRSLGAIVGWFLPGALLLALLGAMAIGSFGIYQSEHYRLYYSQRETTKAVAYGNVIDVEVSNTRSARPCTGAYVDRRLVKYKPGTKEISVVMPIQERSIGDPETGKRSFHLILGMPVPIESDAGWVYQSQQHDNCGFLQSLFSDDGGWIGRTVAGFVSGQDMPSPDTPVTVATTPPLVPGVAFRPAPPDATKGASHE